MARVKSINGSLDSNLNGSNFNHIPSETVFSFGSFSVTSNFDSTRVKDYENNLTTFASPVSLDTIGITSAQSDLLFGVDNNAVLNLDNSNMNTFVKFGSAYEFLRIATQNIILNFPGSIFVDSQAVVGGNITFYDFVYYPLTDESVLKVPSSGITNIFGLVLNMGNTGLPSDNILKNINLSYEDYIVWSTYAVDNVSCKIIGFSGDTGSNPFLKIKTKGNPFPFLTNTTQGRFDFHIKPNNSIFEEFRVNLSDYEKYMISERDGVDGFRFKLKDPTLLDDGNIIFSDTSLLWKTSDGYNVDISTPTYQRYLDSLLTIGTKYDTIKTDLIARFLSPSSLKVYDLTEEGKMTKLLRVYGREFDQVKQFIDSLVYINTVTYDKKNNVPDQLISNLAKTLGWNYFSLLNESELMDSFLSIDGAERNLNTELLPAEVNIELWRRILINTNYFWKSKGTRDAIKAIFLLIGIPEPFVEITEHVYTVSGKIDPRQVTLLAADFPSNSLPFDNSGYPKAPLETNDFYFQTSGNTDSGQAYMNVFRKAGFDLTIVQDNKKSWVQTGSTTRIHSTTPNYYQEDNRLVLNTKEVNVSLDTSRGVENDFWYYTVNTDFVANSTDYVLPYSFINISLGLTGTTQTVFKLPSNYRSNEGDLEIRFNGVLLNGPKTGTTVSTTEADYTISGNEFTLTTCSAISNSANRDVIQATYLYSGGTITGATIKYIVTRIKADMAGTRIPLPNNANGDVQVTINGIALTKTGNQFIGDYTLDPNNPNQIIIQNPELIAFLGAEPNIQVAYLTVTGSTTIAARSEIVRIDSFNSGKIYYNVSANKYVYKLYYKTTNATNIKVLIDGIALEPNRDYTLNTTNPYELFLPSGLRYGNIISVYYIVGGDEYKNPIISPSFGLGDISGLSFMEFVELIQRRLINATNRKTTTDFKGGWYPTLLYVYITYIKRGELLTTDPLYSNAYTFQNLYPFLSKYNAFFQRFIDELLPATIIIRRGGLLIRNTIFTRQKFPYKRGVYMGHIKHLGLAVDATTYDVDNELFYFGNDGSTFNKRQLNIDFDWSDDYICYDNSEGGICSLMVENVDFVYPPTTTTTTIPVFCASLQINTTTNSIPISTPTQEGKYGSSTNRLVFVPSITTGNEITLKLMFSTLLSVSGVTNTDGISSSIITVTKNGVPIFTDNYILTGYNTGITYTASTNVSIVRNDEIVVLLENKSVENIAGGITDWNIISTTIFTPERISGCVNIIVPSSVDNYVESNSVPIPSTACSVFLIGSNKKVYSYEPLTNITTYRFTSPYSSSDIASTSTKLWLIGNNVFNEYDVTLDPFTVSTSPREITFTTNPGSGLCAKNNNTLIGSNNNQVCLYDITGSAAVETQLFSMQSNRVTTGDILYNGTNDTYIIANHDTVLGISYVTQYQSDGTIIVDIVIDETNISSLYQYETSIYCIRGTANSRIYKITNNGLELAQTLSGLQIYGASQSVGCITANLPTGLCENCPTDYLPTIDGRCVKTSITEATAPTSSELAVAKSSTVYGILGALIFDDTYNLNGTTSGSYTGATNSFWKNSGNLTSGPLNRSGVWSWTMTSNQQIGFSVCIEITEEKTYYIGIGSDNFSTIRVDGTNILVQSPAALAAQFGYGLAITFYYWYVYPVTLTAGFHIIEIIGNNVESIASMGAEIYDATPNELIAATSYAELGSKLIFSTKDMRGVPIQIGTGGIGYTCPTGYSLVLCDGAPYCTKIEYVDCGSV